MSSDRFPNRTVGAATDDADSDCGPSHDDVFHVLQCRRRRLVLKYMCETETEPVPVADVEDWLAAAEAAEDVDSPDRSTASIALRHIHLPKMAEHDAVAYDPDRGVIESTAHTDRFERYLEDEPLPSPPAESNPSE